MTNTEVSEVKPSKEKVDKKKDEEKTELVRDIPIFVVPYFKVK